MQNKIISEGKTTQEAVDIGLKQLRVSKDKVEIKVLEQEDKRSFFSILAPRVVKVELTLKEGVTPQKQEIKKMPEREKREEHKERENRAPKRELENKKINKDDPEVKKCLENIKIFLDDFISKLNTEGVSYDITAQEYYISVKISGEKLNYLIGYRGETLNAFQVILSSIASNGSKEKVRILVDIENYREKREKALEELAEKIAKTVIRTKKSVTLEPMTSYERKIIHSKLQENNQITTFSKGEEPRRRLVIALK